MTEPSREIVPETLDYILEQTIAQPERQLGVVDEYAARAFQAIGAGALILTLPTTSDRLSDTAIIVAAILYGVVVLASIIVLWGRTYFIVRGETMWSDLWWAPLPDVKHTLVQNAADSIARNRQILREKWRALRVAVGALVCEALAIAAGATGLF